MSTAKKTQRPALGRGLSALISSSVPIKGNNTALSMNQPEQIVDNDVLEIDIAKIHPNSSQPRKDFNEEELLELSSSIREHGILQPVLLRAVGADSYEIIAGERRWRAAKLAGIAKIPAIVRAFSDKEVLEISIVENIQRQDLNPVEQAKAFQRLMDEFSMTQSDVAEQVGKDRVTVANAIRLLKLPDDVVELIRNGRISVGHAKALLSIKEPHAQRSLAKKVITESLSVRELESLVSRVVVLDGGKSSPKEKMDGIHKREAGLQDIIDRLRMSLGTRVNVRHSKSGKGKIEIEYYSEAELERLVEILSTSQINPQYAER